MIRKSLKFLTILGASGLVVGLCFWFLVKGVLTYKAEEKAKSIIALAYASENIETPGQKAVSIATEIFKNFEQIDPTHVSAYRLRPYLTNKRLPKILRLEDGVMETFLQKGLCDNTARLLSFVLKQEGIESKQWDMVTPSGGHAATLVTLPDNEEVYIDALFGVVATDKNGNLTSPYKAHELIQAGYKPENVFKALGQKSEHKFYRDFSKVSMGAEDQPLVIEAIIPNFEDRLDLGEVDQSPQDVQRASLKHDMGTVWNYAGHRYNRNWVRVLKAEKPIRVVMTLVSNVENGVITSEPKPDIEGNQMIWDLQAGEELKLYDGRAKISLKRLNSYIDVDQLSFYKL